MAYLPFFLTFAFVLLGAALAGAGLATGFVGLGALLGFLETPLTGTLAGLLTGAATLVFAGATPFAGAAAFVGAA